MKTSYKAPLTEIVNVYVQGKYLFDTDSPGHFDPQDPNLGANGSTFDEDVEASPVKGLWED